MSYNNNLNWRAGAREAEHVVVATVCRALDDASEQHLAFVGARGNMQETADLVLIREHSRRHLIGEVKLTTSGGGVTRKVDDWRAVVRNGARYRTGQLLFRMLVVYCPLADRDAHKGLIWSVDERCVGDALRVWEANRIKTAMRSPDLFGVVYDPQELLTLYRHELEAARVSPGGKTKVTTWALQLTDRARILAALRS